MAFEILSPQDGGTGLGSYTTGDVIYASADDVLSALPVGTDGEVLTLVSGVPAWASGGGGGSGQPLQNLGITWDGNSPATISITSADGSALSMSNSGFLSFTSNVLDIQIGLVANYTITANQSFTDSSTGDIAGMRFGATTGVNWSEYCPFYIYAVSKNDDSDCVFMFSRIPGRSTSPSAGDIGKAGAIVNNGDGDFFCMANVTVSDYAGTSCICIGSFTMQFDGATDSWTYTLPNNGYDFGIGVYGENTQYNFPVGQNGANADLHFLTTGTFPDTAQKLARYFLDRFGNLTYNINYAGFNAPGVGTDEIFSISPLRNRSDYFASTGFYKEDNGTASTFIGIQQNAGNNLAEVPISASITNLLCSSFTAGGAGGYIRYTMEFKV